jgi:hypothetical protein
MRATSILRTVVVRVQGKVEYGLLVSWQDIQWSFCRPTRSSLRFPASCMLLRSQRHA